MQDRFIKTLAVGFVVAGAAGVAQAQDVASNKQCEVHVFSNAKFVGMDGWNMLVGGGGGLIGAAISPEINKGSNAKRTETAKGLLTDAFYKTELSNLDIPAGGATIKTAVEVTDAGETAETLFKSKTRNSTSTNDCYFEVYIRAMQIQQNPFFGSRMMTTASVKDFRKPTPDRSSFVTETKIEKHFPPNESEDGAAADDAFMAAARSSFIEKIKSKMTK